MKKSAPRKNYYIAGYVALIIISVIYSINISGQQGWVFTASLLLFPLFSYLEALFLYKTDKIGIETQVLGSMIEKRESAALRVTVSNRSIFPVPLVAMSLYMNDNFHRTDELKKYIGFSVSPRSNFTYDIPVTAEMWGCSPLAIEEAVLHDFMHFFKFRLNTLQSQTGESIVKVIPDVPDAPHDSPALKIISTSLLFDNDSEETKESISPVFTGVPGFTHREYVPGDPVRRINWKLSTKRDKTMIRLDDEIPSVKQVIVLDSCHGKSMRGKADSFYSPACDERTVEGALSVIMALTKMSLDVSFRYFINGQWIETAIESPDDVYNLKIELAGFSFADYDSQTHPQRIPSADSIGSVSCGIIVFTPFPDNILMSEISTSCGNGNGYKLFVPQEYPYALPDSSWIITRDYNTISAN